MASSPSAKINRRFRPDCAATELRSIRLKIDFGQPLVSLEELERG